MLTNQQRKSNNPIKKWAKDLNRHSPQDDTHLSTSSEKMLNITHHQTQIKTTATYRYTSVKIYYQKKQVTRLVRM